MAETTLGNRELKIGEAYAPRPVRPLGVWESGDWLLKVYGIAYGRELPRAEAVAAAKGLVSARLPRPGVGDGRYGVGFLIVHDGRDACWLLLDWWADEDVLYHQLFAAPSDRPIEFAPVTNGASACVWELEILKFERDAWVDSVLTKPGKPDLEAYLRAAMVGDV